MRREYFLFQKEDYVSAKYSNLRMNYFTSDMFFNKPHLITEIKFLKNLALYTLHTSFIVGRVLPQTLGKE